MLSSLIGPPSAALARQPDPDALKENGFIYVFASSWIEVAPWVGLCIEFKRYAAQFRATTIVWEYI
jgi:hypothetical protein